jgi:hypothetical protein
LYISTFHSFFATTGKSNLKMGRVSFLADQIFTYCSGSWQLQAAAVSDIVALTSHVSNTLNGRKMQML